MLNMAMSPSKYNGTALHKTIHEYMGDLTLADALTGIVVPAFDISNPKTRVFSSNTNQQQGGEARPSSLYRMEDICMATIATSSYFPPHSFDSPVKIEKFHLVDRGVTANNPTIRGRPH